MSENSDHDQRFKQMLEVFWSDVLSLVVPALPEAVRNTPPVFLPQEHFTDLPQGERRNLDIVAKLTPTGEEEFVLVHVEVEGKFRSEFPERMWRYYAQLYVRHNCPVVSLALYLKGGPPGRQSSCFTVSAYGRTGSEFYFESLGLSGASAEEYLKRPEKLCIGLASLMRYSGGGEAEHRFACMQRLSREEMTDVQRVLLLDCIGAYLPLRDSAQRARYDALLAQEPQERTKHMELSWSQQLIQQGHQEGLQEGLRKGIQEGRQEGIQEGRQEGIQEGRQEGSLGVLRKQSEKRLKRALREEERDALARKLQTLGAERISDLLLDASPQELLAWLLDPAAR
jgi:hypothetical protein